jgi:hypothetical protein
MKVYIRWKTTRILESYGSIMRETAHQLRRFLNLHKGPGNLYRMRLDLVGLVVELTEGAI